MHNYTPDVVLESKKIELQKGEQNVEVEFSKTLNNDQYAFVCLLKNQNISVQTSNTLVTGLVSVVNGENKAVSNTGKQEPPQGLGVETFEFWCPERRPQGKNLGFEVKPGLDVFGTENLNNGYVRPTNHTNAWVSDLIDVNPKISIEWPERKSVQKIKIMFDTDFDHAMESSLMGHPQRVMPYCVREYIIKNDEGEIIAKKVNNHQTINEIVLDQLVETKRLEFIFKKPIENVPVGVFEILCY